MLYDLHTGVSDGRDDALNWLTERYWRPVYSFIRKKGNNEYDAQDLSQKFFMFWIERDLFAKANHERGRFRNFMLKSLSNFLVNSHRDAHAARRFPIGGFVSNNNDDSDYFDRISADVDSPEELFQRVWLAELLQRVIRKLQDECIVTGKQTHYDIFKHRIISPIMDGRDVPRPPVQQGRDVLVR